MRATWLLLAFASSVAGCLDAGEDGGSATGQGDDGTPGCEFGYHGGDSCLFPFTRLYISLKGGGEVGIPFPLHLNGTNPGDAGHDRCLSVERWMDADLDGDDARSELRQTERGPVLWVKADEDASLSLRLNNSSDAPCMPQDDMWSIEPDAADQALEVFVADPPARLFVFISWGTTCGPHVNYSAYTVIHGWMRIPADAGGWCQ